MSEKYYLPVLFTEEERKRYAEWGMKKEKVLMPFAIITIVIDLLVTVGTVVYVLSVRAGKTYFSMWLAAWGPYVEEISYGIVILLTFLIIKP